MRAFFDSFLWIWLHIKYVTYKALLNLSTVIQGKYYILILQKRNLRLREVKQLIQWHTVSHGGVKILSWPFVFIL